MDNGGRCVENSHHKKTIDECKQSYPTQPILDSPKPSHIKI